MSISSLILCITLSSIQSSTIKYFFLHAFQSLPLIRDNTDLTFLSSIYDYV